MQNHLELEPLGRGKLRRVFRLTSRGRGALLRQDLKCVKLMLALGGLAPDVDPVDAAPLDNFDDVVGRVRVVGAGGAVAGEVVEDLGRVLASCEWLVVWMI